VNKISNELNGLKIEMDTQLQGVRKDMADVITVTKAETKTMFDMGKTENENYTTKLRIDIDKKIEDKIISVSSVVVKSSLQCATEIINLIDRWIL